MFLVMNCLSSCTSVSSDYCPVYPVAGVAVAEELEQAGDLPATWEWIGRIDKLRRELELLLLKILIQKKPSFQRLF